MKSDSARKSGVRRRSRTDVSISAKSFNPGIVGRFSELAKIIVDLVHAVSARKIEARMRATEAQLEIAEKQLKLSKDLQDHLFRYHWKIVLSVSEASTIDDMKFFKSTFPAANEALPADVALSAAALPPPVDLWPHGPQTTPHPTRVNRKIERGDELEDLDEDGWEEAKRLALELIQAETLDDSRHHLAYIRRQIAASVKR